MESNNSSNPGPVTTVSEPTYTVNGKTVTQAELIKDYKSPKKPVTVEKSVPSSKLHPMYKAMVDYNEVRKTLPEWQINEKITVRPEEATNRLLAQNVKNRRLFKNLVKFLLTK